MWLLKILNMLKDQRYMFVAALQQKLYCDQTAAVFMTYCNYYQQLNI